MGYVGKRLAESKHFWCLVVCFSKSDGNSFYVLDIVGRSLWKINSKVNYHGLRPYAARILKPTMFELVPFSLSNRSVKGDSPLIAQLCGLEGLSGDFSKLVFQSNSLRAELQKWRRQRLP